MVGSGRTVAQPLLLAAVVVTGGLLGLQGRLNGELAGRVHSAVATATMSFAVGLVLILPVAATRRRALRRLFTGRTRWWWWLGGLGGALAVASTSQAVPSIGVALVTVCLVAGTAGGALGIDGLGLGPGGRYPVTGVRLAGALVAVSAVGISAIGTHGAAFRPGLFALLILAGVAVAGQQAANGQVRRLADDTTVATTVSFVTGTALLVALSAVRGDLHVHGWPGVWWLYLSGPLGVAYIAVAAATVRPLGVLRVSLATVAGQLLAAVILDAAWPEPGTSLHVATVVGAGVTVVGVWLSGRTGPQGRGVPAGVTG